MDHKWESKPAQFMPVAGPMLPQANAGGAILSDDQLRVRGRRGRRGPPRLAEVREHQLSHRQPDRGGVRKKRMAEPRRRHRRSATSSGQSAEFLTFISLAAPGDDVVASGQLYGGTHTLLNVTLRRLGISTTFVASDDSDDLRGRDRSRRENYVYTELIADPFGWMADLGGLADVAHRRGHAVGRSTRHSRPQRCAARSITSGDIVVVLGDEIPRRPRNLHRRRRGEGAGLCHCAFWRVAMDDGRARHQLRRPRFFDNFGETAFYTKLRVEQLRDIDTCLAPMERRFSSCRDSRPFHCACPKNYASENTSIGRAAPRTTSKCLLGAFGPALRRARTFDRRATFFPPGQARCSARDSRRACRRHALCRVGGDDQPPRECRRRSRPRNPARHRRRTDSSATPRSRDADIGSDLVRNSVGLEDVEDIVYDLDRALSRAVEA